MNGLVYSRSESDYNWTYQAGIYNLSLRTVTNYLYDGNPDDPIITNKSFFYDYYDNLLLLVDNGDVSVDGDEKFINNSYAMNPTFWIMDRLARTSLYDADGKVSETKYYYDDYGLEGVSSGGDLTKTEMWNEGNNSYIRYGYDDWGNMVTMTDSLGHTTRYSYDESHIYPVTTIDALGHIIYFEYDDGTGNLNWKKKNDIRTEYKYDVFGRIVKEIRPYDTSSLPTKEYVYDFDGIAPESVTVHVKSVADRKDVIHYYYDGMANLIQVKNDLDDSQVVKNIIYDDMKVASEQNPYLSQHTGSLSEVSGSANFTYYSYDPVGRIIGVLNPDGTSKNVTFDRHNITDYDENGNSHTYELDAYGRIVRVYEYNVDGMDREEVYTTSYAYDADDRLVRIVDELGNEIAFSYDGLGSKVRMDDPDLGTWSYGYDLNGNLAWQEDARGERVELSYDELGRIVSKSSDDVNTTFSYDEDYYGTLSNLTMNDDIVFRFEYDDRLRVVKDSRIIDGIGFNASYLYDSQDRLISKTGLSELDFIFDHNGKVKEIPGYIDGSSYSAFGSIINRSYANGLVSSFYYDEENNRLKLISGIQDIAYTYDSVGNVISINESGRMHLLRYDNLDRLVEATIDGDSYRYSYNPVGSITSIIHNNESTHFAYGRGHMPLKVFEGPLGIDVYGIKEIGTGTKNRTFEVFLKNEGNESLASGFGIDYGDGSSFADNITVPDEMWMFIEHNYSEGGDYDVKVTTDSDEEAFDVGFGARIDALRVIDKGLTEHAYELVIGNDITEGVKGLSWECSGTESDPLNLSGFQSFYSYFVQDITWPGRKTVDCRMQSDDGSGNISLSYDVEGLEIDSFDVLQTDVSRQVAAFEIRNHFLPVVASLDIDGDEDTINISSDMMAFVELNSSSDGLSEFGFSLSAGNYTENYVESTVIEGVSIGNYYRLPKNGSVNVLLFDVRNDWHDGDVGWTILDVENTTHLAHNKSLFVMIEHDFARSAKIDAKAKVSSYTDYFSDYLSIKPLELSQLQSLSDDVTEMVIKNNLNGTMRFDLDFDDGDDTFSHGMNVTGTVFAFVEMNHSSPGVYRTTAFINGSSYNDTRSGVVVLD